MTTVTNAERFRMGLVVALIAVGGAVLIRGTIVGGNDQAIYAHRAEATGIDFGDWPGFFYTSAGGDGEVFAVVATDPWGVRQRQSIRSFVYRYSRIGFSLLVWSVSFGREQFVLPAIAAIGIVSVGLVGFFSGYLRDRIGLRAWLLVLNPALYIGFMGDTAEPLAILLLMVVLTNFATWPAAVLATVRPSFMTAFVGRWRTLALAVATAAVVRIFAVWRFGGPINDGTQGNLAFPGFGYLDQPSLMGLVVGLGGLVTLAIGFKRRDWSWVASGLLVVSFGPIVLGNPINAVRGAGMLPVLWAFGPTSYRKYLVELDARQRE